VVALLATSSCLVRRRQVVAPGAVGPALDATPVELLGAYNRRAAGVHSLNAAVLMIPTVGSAFTGAIEEYREVRGFLLAQKPAQVRLIGQAPVVAKNIFDMVSDGETFRIFIPSKNRFVTGPAAFERRGEKPIENLRPQHLLDAVFWPELGPEQPVLFEEFDELGARGVLSRRYYVLTALRRSAGGYELDRKLWFDRADLRLARVQIYTAGGRLAADVRYTDWQPIAALDYPRLIRLARPQDDYQLEVRIQRLTMNEDVAAERFVLEQPAGVELVRVGPERPEAQR
jgi:hypothetical protein